ncbi:histidine phosphatase superfamily protein, clade-1, partial [Kipferlia bialata]|eukprot:g9621.t1
MKAPSSPSSDPAVLTRMVADLDDSDCDSNCGSFVFEEEEGDPTGDVSGEEYEWGVPSASPRLFGAKRHRRLQPERLASMKLFFLGVLWLSVVHVFVWPLSQPLIVLLAATALCLMLGKEPLLVWLFFQQEKVVKRKVMFHRKPKRIILVRHGESDGNVSSDAYATTPDNQIQLTERGRAEAERAGQELAQLVGVQETVRFFLSPYTRTKQTLQGILKGWGLPED